MTGNHKSGQVRPGHHESELNLNRLSSEESGQIESSKESQAESLQVGGVRSS